MTRRRVRLTAKDWHSIYLALALVVDADGAAAVLTTPEELPPMQRALAKIGVDGMAASRRGVAPVRRTVR